MGISASWIRVLRAAVFAALCVTLATGAHVLLSGAPLPLPTVALVAAGVFAVTLLLAGDRERGFWPIAGLLVPLQLAADTVFTAGQATCYGPGGGPVTGPLRLLGVDLFCGGGDLGAPLAGLAVSGPGPLTASPWLLLAAHLAVGLLAAGWLRGGEAALARLLRATMAATFRPLLLAVAAVAAPRPARRPLPHPIEGERPAPALPVLAHSVLRRGPPAAPRYAPA
ncbi:hypothetical protein E1265_31120 [Streptomyces sp. 8K308]|uniref:hypothetical protein n=1 Tax=Streptomyces sp. 8K308 TaxID=2530388 RepID=UPI00104D32A6|nr:hypothetical protein [Streptomyces sp. 8K308]TDC10584.1 hypothetical protein E1265_31120 [Streptomyces sp. 8K308]